MKENGKTILQNLATRQESPEEKLRLLTAENDRLAAEISLLKTNLEKEQFYQHNLYKQWSELKASMVYKDNEIARLRSSSSPKLVIYKYLFFASLVVSALITGYQFFLRPSPKITGASATVVTLPVKPPVTKIADSTAPLQSNQKLSIEPPVTGTPVTTAPGDVSPASTVAIAPSGTKYKVMSKSFFYNRPDERHRRNTFVLPGDDSYGTVTAIKEQGGYIFIEFKNRAGYTSKGWLLKKSLQPVVE